MKFSELLEQVDAGRAHEVASELLERLIEAVEAHGQPGHVQITQPMKEADHGAE